MTTCIIKLKTRVQNPCYTVNSERHKDVYQSLTSQNLQAGGGNRTYTWISVLLHLQNIYHPILYQHLFPPSFHAACSWTSLGLPVSGLSVFFWSIGLVSWSLPFSLNTKVYHFSHPCHKNSTSLNIYLSNSPALKTPIHWTCSIICDLSLDGGTPLDQASQHPSCVPGQFPLPVLSLIPLEMTLHFSAQKKSSN